MAYIQAIRYSSENSMVNKVDSIYSKYSSCIAYGFHRSDGFYHHDSRSPSHTNHRVIGGNYLTWDPNVQVTWQFQARVYVSRVQDSRVARFRIRDMHCHGVGTTSLIWLVARLYFILLAKYVMITWNILREMFTRRYDSSNILSTILAL